MIARWLRRWLGLEALEYATDDLRTEVIRLQLRQMAMQMDLERLKAAAKKAADAS